MNTLSTEQEAAVTSDAQTTYVIAGPGSGKSHTLIARVAHHVANGIDPRRLWLLTFTNAGGHVFKERLAALGITVGFAGTLHSAMFRLIQSHGAAIGYQAGRVSLITEDERDAMLEDARKLLAPKLKKSALTPTDRTVMSVAEKFDAAIVMKSFSRKLKLANCVDYDGVLTAGRALLDVPKVQEALDIHELLVDEVQDSCADDWSIFDAMPCASRFICGDPDQSIFAFRGAHPEIFVKRVESVTPFSDAMMGDAVFKLQTNYRSGPTICDAANNLIRHNDGRVEKWCIAADGAPRDTAMYLPCADEATEISMIRHCLGVQNEFSTAESPSVPYSEMAVIARTNVLVKQYRQRLREAGIPVKEPKFPETPHDWELCMALIAAMYSPGNAIVVERLLRVLGNAPAQIEEWRREADLSGRSLAMVANVLPMVPPSLEELPTALVVQSISPQSVALVSSRISVLPQNEPTLGDLMQDLWSHDAHDDTSGDGVHVGTIHSVKGLEFECVIVAACEEGTIPGNERDIEEHRRLMFVAVTRAKRFLYLASAGTRWKYGKPETCAPSRFLGEMNL